MKSFRTLSSSLVLVTALALVAGCGSNSAGPSAPEVDTTPPPVPATVSVAVDDVTGDVTIAWEASSAPDLASYEVESTTSGGTYALAAEVPSTTSEWTLPAVEGRSREWYRVRAIDTSGNASGWSRAIEVVRGEYNGGPRGDDNHIDD